MDFAELQILGKYLSSLVWMVFLRPPPLLNEFMVPWHVLRLIKKTRVSIKLWESNLPRVHCILGCRSLKTDILRLWRSWWAFWSASCGTLMVPSSWETHVTVTHLKVNLGNPGKTINQWKHLAGEFRNEPLEETHPGVCVCVCVSSPLLYLCENAANLNLTQWGRFLNTCYRFQLNYSWLLSTGQF